MTILVNCKVKCILDRFWTGDVCVYSYKHEKECSPDIPGVRLLLQIKPLLLQTERLVLQSERLVLQR